MATTITLKLNEPATLVVTFNDLWAPSEGKVKAALDKALYPFAYIQKVDEPFFSDDFIVTFVPRQARTELSWQQSIIAALKGAGYKPEIQGRIEGGFESSAAGGLLGSTKTMLTSVTEAPGVTRAMSTVKWASIAVIGLVSLFYLAPTITGMRASRRRY